MARTRSIDQSIYGDEPTFDGPVDRIALMHAFNWYNYFGDAKEDRKWIWKYMETNGYSKEDIRLYKSNDSKSSLHHCNVARMLLRGAEFEHNLDSHIKETIDTAPKTEIIVSKSHNNIVIEYWDGELDKFYTNYKPLEIEFDINRYNRSDIQDAKVYYTSLLDELNTISSDTEIKEGYKHLTRVKLRNYIQFVQAIVDKLSEKKVRKIVVRKPRKKKEKTKAANVKKVKYLQFSKKLEMESISATEIVSSSVVYCYNETFNKIVVYHAKSGELLTIRGSTITNFDPAKSFEKRIRKAKAIAAKVKTEPRKRLESIVEAIKSKSGQPSGRITSKTLLLRTFK